MVIGRDGGGLVIGRGGGLVIGRGGGLVIGRGGGLVIGRGGGLVIGRGDGLVNGRDGGGGRRKEDIPGNDVLAGLSSWFELKILGRTRISELFRSPISTGHSSTTIDFGNSFLNASYSFFKWFC